METISTQKLESHESWMTLRFNKYKAAIYWKNIMQIIMRLKQK